MASVGHLAVGMATARLYHAKSPSQRVPVSSMLFWSALSFLPDADVAGLPSAFDTETSGGIAVPRIHLFFHWPSALPSGVAAWLIRRPPVRTGVGAGALPRVTHSSTF